VKVVEKDTMRIEDEVADIMQGFLTLFLKIDWQ